MKYSIILVFASMLAFSCSGGSNQPKSSQPVSLPEKEPVLKVAEDLSNHPGQALYNQHCLPCHQADGNGVPGMYPPITDKAWIDGDNARLISIVLHGLDEEIEVHGESYNTVMAALPYLSDQEVADVLNFIRNKFGSEEADFTVEEVASVRAKG